MNLKALLAWCSVKMKIAIQADIQEHNAMIITSNNPKFSLSSVQVPRYYSGEYPRLSRGRPGFDSPPGRLLFPNVPCKTFLFDRILMSFRVPGASFDGGRSHRSFIGQLPPALSWAAPSQLGAAPPWLACSTGCVELMGLTFLTSERQLCTRQ